MIETEAERKLLPSLSFHISTSDKDKVFIPVLEESRETLVQAWGTFETPFLTSLDEVTGEQWYAPYRSHGIPITLVATERSGVKRDSKYCSVRLACRELSNSYTQLEGLPIGATRDTTSLIGSLTHEITHLHASPKDIEFVEKNYINRIDTQKLQALSKHYPNPIRTVSAEAHTELVWKDAVQRTFPEDMVKQWERRRRVQYKGVVYDFIDKLSDEERNLIVSRHIRKDKPQLP